jgi:hypothetical protein
MVSCIDSNTKTHNSTSALSSRSSIQITIGCVRHACPSVAPSTTAKPNQMNRASC